MKACVPSNSWKVLNFFFAFFGRRMAYEKWNSQNRLTICFFSCCFAFHVDLFSFPTDQWITSIVMVISMKWFSFLSFSFFIFSFQLHTAQMIAVDVTKILENWKQTKPNLHPSVRQLEKKESKGNDSLWLILKLLKNYFTSLDQA